VKRMYILKRVEPQSSTIYVFERKSAMKEFIKKAMDTEGGVWMQLVVHFNNEDEVWEFIKKCYEYANVIVYR
jgi:hypothetical protein